MRQRPFLPFICFALSLAVVPKIASAEAGGATDDVDFAREILPILSEKCFVCHGPDSDEAGNLRLDSFAAATADRGGYQAINPDNPSDSELLARIHSDDSPMPPEEAGKPLTDQEKELLNRWVLAGGAYAQHWSFVTPQKPTPPRLQWPASSGNESVDAIDAFVLQKLASKKIAVAPSADRATLARRAALVLTGLPPDLKDLDRFLADPRDDAYERFVDNLLQSPRYGEHQARFWLDAVRYGDTHGLHLDNRRGIYPYRDWVVQAFNDNLPLDQFITWQLAGDLLPNPSLAQQVATGFVRLNPSTGEGGAIAEEFQAKNNFDRVETFGTVFLGMSLTCARCHTHKYDPIPHMEYYRLLAFFNNTAEPALDGNSYTYGPVAKVPSDHAAWSRWSQLESQRDALLGSLSEKSLPPEKRDELITYAKSSADWTAAHWDDAAPLDQLRILADPHSPLSDDALRQRAKQLLEKIDQEQANFTTSLIAQELPEPRPTYLLKRGDYEMATGEPLEPGVLRVLGEFPGDAPRNRLGLAHWLTDRQHPLVARVLVNRLWQIVFGAGLVRTPEEFGLQGQQPTHPELLDWLAVELHESDWDMKHLLRLMVTSQTFRQNSAWRKDVDDPDNRLLARGPAFRLDAEVLRDLGLWASHLLNPRMGGEGVKPYQPDGMWKALAHPASNTKQYVRDEGPPLYRRSLYVYWKRTSPHPMMTLFDAPDRESSCVRRSRTNTALQSLGLLNETQRVEIARHFAQRLLQERTTDQERLQHAFKLLTSRMPDPQEQAICEQLLSTMKQRYHDDPESAIALLDTGDATRDPTLDAVEHAAWAQLAATLLASDIAIQLY